MRRSRTAGSFGCGVVLLALGQSACSGARADAETAAPARQARPDRAGADAGPSTRSSAACDDCPEPTTRSPGPVVALPEGSASDFAACAVEVRATVRKLASANYPDERSSVTKALTAFADCVAQAPDKPDEVARLVGEVRRETKRIREASSVEPKLAGWIKSALIAVVDAIDALPVDRGDYDATWVTPARRAAGAIEGDEALVFQRAPIQDAFRAAADAMVVAARATVTAGRKGR